MLSLLVCYLLLINVRDIKVNDFLEAVKLIPLFIPLKKQIKTNLHTLAHITCLYMLVYTKQGIVGHSLLDGLGKISYQDVEDKLENYILPLMRRRKISDPEVSWQRIWESNCNHHSNVAWRSALAALDIALWDIHTKLNNISLHHYIGGERDYMPVYGSTGWISLSNEELIQECQWYASKGVNAFKVRLGHQDDIHRIASLRNVMGDDFLIMVDANQRYTTQEAISVASKLEKFNIFWFEEPIRSNSVEELIMLSNKSGISIALGENMYDMSEFSEICNASVVNYMQLDLAKVGGISAFLKIAEIVEKTKHQLCNHLFSELSAGILSVFPNACLLEHDNCFPPEIFTQDFAIKNGAIKIPTVSGTGIELTNEALLEFGNKERKEIIIS